MTFDERVVLYRVAGRGRRRRRSGGEEEEKGGEEEEEVAESDYARGAGEPSSALAT